MFFFLAKRNDGKKNTNEIPVMKFHGQETVTMKYNKFLKYRFINDC